jgi:hypothetical protein
MEKAVSFWAGLLQKAPSKNSKWWSEFRCENINLGILWMENFSVDKDQSNFVPVFELSDSPLEPTKERALAAGASVVVDIANHPDKKSYVLADPFGNEFEITKFHD